YAFNIMPERLFGQQLPFRRLKGRVSYHPRSPANERNGLMTGPLKMDQGHHLGEMAHMKGVGRGIKTDIAGNNALLQLFFGSRHNVMQHAPPTELFHEIPVHTGDKDSISAENAPLVECKCEQE